MKEQVKIWLIAFAMGVLLPAMLFSVVEKMTERNINQPDNESFGSTVEQPKEEHADAGHTRTVNVKLSDGKTVEMALEDYLTGVLLGEMPADFHEEALKAQSVVARTYTLKRSTTGEKHTDGAVCVDSACCQAYCSEVEFLSKGGTLEALNKIKKAVRSTAGQVLTYNGNLIEATYFSCSGGRTEDAVAVWGTHIPYLQAVDSPGEENATHYTDTVVLTASRFAQLLEIDPTGSPSSWFGTVSYTPGGGVDTMVIAGTSFRGTTLRKKLDLSSTAIKISVEGNLIRITTKGFGHRVGMSQYGAEAMAVSGKEYGDILFHYYPNTELVVHTQN